MKKYILLLIALIATVTCSSEASKIKGALKQSISEELISKYKLKDYSIVETILDANIRDSIATLESKIRLAESRMKADSSRLLNIQADIASVKHSQATTLSWLRSSYNSIIRSYKEMEEDILDNIEERQQMIDSYTSSIKEYEGALASTNSPIIYYVVKHNYTINGAVREDIITLDSNYHLVNN